MRYSLRAKTIHAVPHLDNADPDVIARIINALHLERGVDSVIGADVESQSLILRMRDRLTCPIFPISDPATLQTLNNKWTSLSALSSSRRAGAEDPIVRGPRAR